MLHQRKKDAHIFVIIAIGANLSAPDGASPRQTCEWAVRAVAAIPGLSGAVRSRWVTTAPVPPSGQPDYVNGVVRLCGSPRPEALLAALAAIENAAGRRRSVPNAARTLDLDIIDMGGLVRTAPDPILPHPRAHLRSFVLQPLRDVAPDWVHPSLGVGVATLLEELDRTGG